MKIIITGASMGIGRGIAAFLGREGFKVGLLARSQDRLEEVCREIQTFGGTAECAPCDLRDPEATRITIERLTRKLGGLDALINNAGLVVRKDVWQLTLDEWHAMIDTNLNGLFYVTRAALGIMREQRRGHIINISSISGRMPLPGGSAYAATKYAVSGFTESLFQEVRDNGIKVTLVFPGSVDSASHRHDPTAPSDWKIHPEEVGQACRDILRTSPNNVISRLEIRPLQRPPK